MTEPSPTFPPTVAAAGVSPGSPNRAPNGHEARVRVAFLGRVSTDDQQDPTLSLPRQLGNSQAALPPGWEITAWFWDIEVRPHRARTPRPRPCP